ncbi:hypothetical protein TcasGA2_TC000716 [Tribolium castaneum]|uniref:Uncharacterized protein n=1 Tax=Tribolium castaneum TaxID=7070 RepID=D6W8R8_TRICA|nr:hypothetical protein TcasGA2_TC000716 [Tribolium castaneum]
MDAHVDVPTERDDNDSSKRPKNDKSTCRNEHGTRNADCDKYSIHLLDELIISANPIEQRIA